MYILTNNVIFQALCPRQSYINYRVLYSQFWVIPLRESPKIKNTTLRKRRKFEIKNYRVTKPNFEILSVLRKILVSGKHETDKSHNLQQQHYL
jgi:hypothetical protein